MKIRMMSRLQMTLLVLLAVTGCTTDDGPSAPQGGTIGDADAILPITFYHVKDSDGGKGAAGVDVVMVFEPNGIVDLYTAHETDALAYKGSYGFDAGKLKLKFTDPDMKVDATFALDTSQATVTMPFKAFSAGTGSSTWRRERRPLEENMQTIFNAASIEERLPTAKAIERVAAYASAFKGTARLGKRASIAAAGPVLTDVKPHPTGVRLQYDNGPYVNVQLFSWALGNGKPLNLSPIASDPRIHLDPSHPHNPAADPLEKTALFYAPFLDDNVHVTWYDYDYANGRAPLPTTETVHKGWGKYYDMNDMTAQLQVRGYQVKVLKNQQADLIGLIEAILPGRNGGAQSPGFMAVMTHGGGDGELLTGTFLGDSANWMGTYQNFLGRLKSSGYGDLLTYGGGTEDHPTTFGVTVLARTRRPGGTFYTLEITPKFWEWARARGANFNRSLVFVAACLTDNNPALREAIQARAYFAFNTVAYVAFVSKALQYVTRQVGRATHSAEEAYYNLIRVMHTRLKIYPEDALLDGNVPEVAKQADSAIYVFVGYGYDGKTMVPYDINGWMNTRRADPGAIWWLLFGGRWGQDAQGGAEGMLSCWQSLWKDGQTGGLGDPLCHNKAPGRAPTQEEVAYASYLLTGRPILEAPDMRMVPRWTLNDAR